MIIELLGKSGTRGSMDRYSGPIKFQGEVLSPLVQSHPRKRADKSAEGSLGCHNWVAANATGLLESKSLVTN